ncbi:MAG: ribosome recycling factor [Proteobacteria bacterium]|nr:ribosome recycling factor [Pseudomonadota bacterium]
MSKELISELKKRMTTAFDIVHKDFSGLRTGRASPSLLESVTVDAYGSRMHINQVGNINVPEPRLLTVQIWDESLAPAVEKAIREAGLGLNPSSAGAVIRVPLPELSEERRKELVKVAGKYAEQGRIAIRNIRRDGMDQIKTLEKEGDVSEDESHRLTDEVQKVTDEFIKKVDEALTHKEKEILQV